MVANFIKGANELRNIIRKQYVTLSLKVLGLPQWISGKELICKAGAASSIPGSGRSPGGGHGIPLQYSCLEDPMDRGAWRGTVHRVAKTEATQHS